MRSNTRFRSLAVVACLTAALVLFFTPIIPSPVAEARGGCADAQSGCEHPPNTPPETGAQSEGQPRSRETGEVRREASTSLAYREAKGATACSPSPDCRSSMFVPANAVVLAEATPPTLPTPRGLKSGEFACGAVRSPAGHTTDDYIRQPIYVMRS